MIRAARMPHASQRAVMYTASDAVGVVLILMNGWLGGIAAIDHAKSATVTLWCAR